MLKYSFEKGKHVRIFLDLLRGKFYGKHLVRYLKMDGGGGAETVISVSRMINKMM